MRIKIIFPFLLISLLSFSKIAKANSPLDSLYGQLNEISKVKNSLQNDTLKAILLCKISSYIVGDQPTKAYDFLNQAEKIITHYKWEKGQITLNYYKGFYYISIHQHIKATEYLYRGLSFAEKMNDMIMLGRCYYMLGISYSSLKNFQSAKSFTIKSINIFKKLNKVELYIDGLNYLGILLIESNKYAEALKYLKIGLAECRKVKQSNSELYFLENIAICQKNLGQLKEAMELFSKVKIIQDEESSTSVSDKIFTLANLAETSRLLLDYPKANTYLGQAYKLNKEASENAYVKELYKVSYSYYKDVKNYKEALKYYEKYIVIEEKTISNDLNRQINNLKFEYENEKKSRLLVLADIQIKEERKTRITFLIGYLLLFSIGGWLLYNRIQLSRKNKKIQQQNAIIIDVNHQLENLNKNLESIVEARTHELSNVNKELVKKNEEILTALVEGQTLERKRVAVELHDNLGAMLSAMRWRLQILNPEKLNVTEQKVYRSILDMMGQAYSEIRLISHNLLPVELEKKGLKGALEKLTNDINLGNKLNLDFHIEEDINLGNKRFELEIYSICLELINNILKHSEATKANISIYVLDNELIVEVYDNGVGMDINNLKAGMGLKNVINRVESNNGQVKIISSQSEKTSIFCTFPYMTITN
ncbi:histidine kinase [Flectobacillus sp. DC10W]|uniref:histidine kinase n=1 Tax=Flectobacillus longus TaxID=2984207 RepID=A0ABT6YKH5_9BACT|nr:ATP-binding protein [Flectobacillus longus]MDI9864096.1 histidine kinase [Flectobacillus longus]